MNYADQSVSLRRNERFLTEQQKAQFAQTEAELIAIDRSVNIAKQTGAWDRLRDQFAIRAELYMEGR